MMKIRTNILNIGLATLMGSSLHGASIVYQDNFDNDGVAANTGIGGGMALAIRQGQAADFVDNGDLTSLTNAHNERGNFYSINDFNGNIMGLHITSLILPRSENTNPVFGNNSISCTLFVFLSMVL